MTDSVTGSAAFETTVSASTGDLRFPSGARCQVGSPEWENRRRMLWDQDARDLMAALIKYEDEHPADAICLAPVLEAARRTVPRA